MPSAASPRPPALRPHTAASAFARLRRPRRPRRRPRRSGPAHRPGNRPRRLGLAVTLVALATVLASAVAAQPPAPSGAEPFDLDADGRVGDAEFRHYLVERIRLPLRAIDDDGDGRISSAELAHFGILLGSVESSVEEYRKLHPDGLDMTSFAAYAGIEPPPRPTAPTWFERTGLLVRGKLEPIGLDKAAKPLSAAGAATLSFSRDLDDGRAWSTLKGVLMRPIRFESRPDLALIPSVAVNQVRYRERERAEVDSLGFRVSLDRLYRLDGDGLFESVGVRANPAFITDTDAETRILVAELQVQASPPATVGGESLYGGLELRWQPALLTEYGRVIADPDEEVSDDGDHFGRVGPSLDAELRLAAIEGLTLGISWEYLATALGRQRDRKRVETTLTLALDRDGHFSVQALYVNGDASSKLEDEAYWSLGLGVKY